MKNINLTKGTCDFCLADDKDTIKLNQTYTSMCVNGKTIEFCKKHLLEFQSLLNEYIIKYGAELKEESI